jgi:NTP pyrophosphatase (non-canonical NTP hydrolase)
MTDKTYLEKTKRTLSTEDNYLEHMAYGLVTESGEILDALKKHKFYGRELDVQNLKEEVGDLMWYLIQFVDILDYSLDEAKIDNIKKLEKRYPEKFVDVVKRNQSDELSHIS